MSTDWAKHCIWWHVYPLGFTGAPITQEPTVERSGTTDAPPAHRLGVLEDWLDYVVELGASGLLLGPIFTSHSHGYDTTDQYQIDPRLGTTRDFDRLVAACHKRGLRLLLDGVFNHVGSTHPWLQQALREGQSGKYAAFFRLDWKDPLHPVLDSFEGHHSLVPLNHENPQVVDYVVDVMRTWLGRGIDGWRLDAAYAVPTEFWRSVIPRVREDFPDSWFLGEVIHGDYSEIVQEATIDSLTQYELWKAIWSSIKDRNYWELDAALERHNTFLDHFTPNTFIGNHDVTRIATAVGKDGAIMAMVVLMTVGGIPSIYYGDEQAYTGLKEERFGGDDQIRPVMPEKPEYLSDLGAPTYHLYQELIALRRRHPWLTTARTERMSLTNEAITYITKDADDFLRVSLDLSDGYSARISDPAGKVIFSFRG